MRFTKIEWGAVVALGLLLGFALAAQRSGMLGRAVAEGEQPDKKKGVKAAPKLQPLESLPKPEAPFNGEIDRNAITSKPDFPREVKAPKGAPNVLLIMADDVGFGASSTYGGPIQTPNYTKLAKRGLKYNRFHTTALCS